MWFSSTYAILVIRKVLFFKIVSLTKVNQYKSRRDYIPA